MGEDVGDYGGLDGGDELQGAAAQGTVFHIDLEHPFEQPAQIYRQASREGADRGPLTDYWH